MYSYIPIGRYLIFMQPIGPPYSKKYTNAYLGTNIRGIRSKARIQNN